MTTLLFLFYDLCFFPALACMLIAGLASDRGRRFFFQTSRWRNLKERLALGGAARHARIWVHAASLGEVKALTKFLTLIKTDPRDLPVHLTCMTDPAVVWASANHLRQGLVVSVALAPFDQSLLMRRYLRSMPGLRALVVIETEMWPNLIRCCKQRGLKLFWVNCRLAEGSRKLIGLMPGLFHHLAKSFAAVMTCDTASTRLFKDAGVALADLSQPGNMKWDSVPAQPSPASARQARQQAGVMDGDFLFVAASTRPGEESVVFDAFAALR